MVRPPVTAIFGGSFDPPHYGHLAIVSYLFANHLDRTFDRVFVMPCRGHAFGKKLSPFEHRINMCKILFRSCYGPDMVSIVNREALDPPDGADYTIDDIHGLKRMYPEDDLRLVVGSDVWGEFDKWKDAEEIKSLVPIIVVPRGSDSIIPTPISDICSHDIRVHLALESRTDYKNEYRVSKFWIPDSIFNYVSKNNLYKRDVEFPPNGIPNLVKDLPFEVKPVWR